MRTILGTFLLLLTVSGSVSGQSWPAKPIRLVSPYAPGGTNDVTARIVAERLQVRLGQPVLVENKPGANIRIATELVVRSEPDGHTLLCTAAPHTVNPALHEKLPYDTLKDLVPIVQTVILPLVLAVPAASPARDLREFLAHAKSRSDAASVATGGNASGAHLSLELLIAASGVSLSHVPYKGDAPAVNDLLGGRVAAGLHALGTPLPHVRSGRLRALAVVADSRAPQLPDVPTFAEAGYPTVDAHSWFGLLAPAGTSPSIVDRLNFEINAALKLPETRERFFALGALPVGGSAAEFERFIRTDLARWKKLVRERNIKSD